MRLYGARLAAVKLAGFFMHRLNRSGSCFHTFLRQFARKKSATATRKASPTTIHNNSPLPEDEEEDEPLETASLANESEVEFVGAMVGTPVGAPVGAVVGAPVGVLVGT